MNIARPLTGPTRPHLHAKRRALVTLHTRYIREAMAAAKDTDARRVAFESAQDIEHALRALDDRLETLTEPRRDLELHTRIYEC